MQRKLNNEMFGVPSVSHDIGYFSRRVIFSVAAECISVTVENIRSGPQRFPWDWQSLSTRYRSLSRMAQLPRQCLKFVSPPGASQPGI